MTIECASAAYLGKPAGGARAVNQKRGARGNSSGFSLAGDQNQGKHSPLAQKVELAEHDTHANSTLPSGLPGPGRAGGQGVLCGVSWVVVPAQRLLQPCCWQLRATLATRPHLLAAAAQNAGLHRGQERRHVVRLQPLWPPDRCAPRQGVQRRQVGKPSRRRRGVQGPCVGGRAAAARVTRRSAQPLPRRPGAASA